MMMVFESLLNNTFTLSRRARLPDGQGGWTIMYAALGMVEGRIRPATSGERETAAREERQITHVLYVVDGQEVARGDLVECGELTVEVLGVREPSLAGHHLEVDCLERQAEVSGEVGT